MDDRPAPDLIEAIRTAHRTHGLLPDGTLVVAVSGGPDSVALLHALHELVSDASAGSGDEVGAEGDARDGRSAPPGSAEPIPTTALHVAHLDHGLRPGSIEDAAFVERLARDLGIPATLDAIDVSAIATVLDVGLEAAARRARYAFLAAVAVEVGARSVVTGHHADDQAETVLMNIIRGAGLEGLTGMAPRSRWPVGTDDIRNLAGAHVASGQAPTLIRPLLDVRRRAIRRWLDGKGLPHREDPSNRDRTLLRNRVRHDVLPHLEGINPSVVDALSRMAETVGTDLDFVQLETDAAWERVARTADDARSPVVRLDRARLRSLHAALQRRVIRRAAATVGGDLRELGMEHVEAVRDAANAEGGFALALPGRLSATMDAEHVRIGRPHSRIPPARLPESPIRLEIPGRRSLPGGWRIEVEERARKAGRIGGRDPWHAHVDADALPGPLAVRRRLAGDRIEPLGMGGRGKSLQDLFVDAKVPEPERDTWPVVIAGERIVWVAGLRLDQRSKIHEGTRRIVVIRVSPPDRVVG